MAQLTLGENRWRMLRRVVGRKRFRYADARNMTRQDQQQFDWLVAHGFVVSAGDGTFELTDKGRAAADLGLYEWEPGAAGAEGSVPSKRPRSAADRTPKAGRNR